MDNKKLIYIEWQDARGASPEWREIDIAREDGMCICKSIGWVIRENDKFIQLAPHFGQDPEQVCGDMTIPKSAIIKKLEVNIIGS